MLEREKVDPALKAMVAFSPWGQELNVPQVTKLTTLYQGSSLYCGGESMMMCLAMRMA